ncbi:nitrate reductase cytochrome c-type subunit [Agaribacterium haliotis]|uniref:nitrate reductase cytochrome c-type subunit n=1 Tax=Agaribacterium haliotis TaxID=2013869 RepID=UPI000BB5332E|nr:nitrate reductase cytochrome c-type subunit [Agaribacterium haliotis]
MKKLLILATLSSALFSVLLYANEIATLRQGTPLDEVSTNPAPMQNVSNTDVKEIRAYPMQPPMIPHKIDNYQVDLKANKCLSCHARDMVGDSQATMISVTHFMDRDGNFLADVSPRRYFCTQCHVPQVERKDLVENEFEDIKTVIKQ